MQKIKMVDLKEAADRRAKDELILDVRTPEEFKDGHVPGARNINHTDVAQHAAELKPFKTVYVYCRSGGRVGVAAMDLMQAGITQLVLVQGGGMPDWIAAGLPIER